MAKVKLGEATVDLERGAYVRGGQSGRLSTNEVGVLRCLCEANGSVVSRDELLQTVWGYDRAPVTRAVDVVVARLRKKLERDPGKPVAILTVRSSGYRAVVMEERADERRLDGPKLVGRDRECEALAARLRTPSTRRASCPSPPSTPRTCC
jgi:DNA-binding winged helix-turn-helix (wHTH) protein